MNRISLCRYFLYLSLLISCFTAASAFGQDMVSPLVKTQWWQRGLYAKFVPVGSDNDRLGCWSTALAQITAYHALSPRGQANYVSAKTRTTINEDFSAYRFNPASFPAKLTQKTNTDLRDEVARYSYFAAVVLQKNFGTTKYQLGGKERLRSIELHYPVEAAGWASGSGFDREAAWEKIHAELDAGNPVLYYTESRDKKNFHAMVVDGYRQEAEKKEIHINFGWAGQGDGWYDFFSPIITPSGKFYFDNLEYFYLITIHPK